MSLRMTRREFTLATMAASSLPLRGAVFAAETTGCGLATGVRAGEMTATTARIWTRLTAAAERGRGNGQFESAAAGKRTKPRLTEDEVNQLQGACPAANGRVRVRYQPTGGTNAAAVSDWAPVTTAGDGIQHFSLDGLQSGVEYRYEVEGVVEGAMDSVRLEGRFRTAPAESAAVPVRFCVMTCQGYHDRGHPDGHPIYPAMLALQPDFAVLTGDLVYYDNDAPTALNARMARYHWERMFSLPRLREFNRLVGCYWLKDDHDTLENDSWPGASAGELTYAAGQEIFRQQSPLADGPSYRTFRWGRDLQIWFTDGRDFRSANSLPDGPAKTIWGEEQKRWFKETVAASGARWKVLVSPTPLVGPDRPKKNDNHANEGFQHEGDELRSWLKAHVPENFFVICGDRHWQYHSVHPATGVQEFSAGPASDEHAGGTPGENRAMHRFHRVKGGFLSVAVTPEGPEAGIVFRHHDVSGKVVYEFAKRR